MLERAHIPWYACFFLTHHTSHQGGFEMLLWGLAGFVLPVKSGKVFEQALGITVEDEFFKDNAIEVRIIHQSWSTEFETISELRNPDVLDGHGFLLLPSKHIVTQLHKRMTWWQTVQRNSMTEQEDPTLMKRRKRKEWQSHLNATKNYKWDPWQDKTKQQVKTRKVKTKQDKPLCRRRTVMKEGKQTRWWFQSWKSKFYSALLSKRVRSLPMEANKRNSKFP